MIYLDHNATTPVCSEAREAMRPFFEAGFGNPSSDYPVGRAARAALEEARSRTAAAIGATPDEIVFTSCATESNNTVILGAARALKDKGRRVVATAVEHPSVTNPVLHLLENGWDAEFVGVDGAGRVDPDAVQKALRPGTVLLSVMHANNETGSIQPVAEIGRMCRQRGVLFHVDAAQSMGKIPVNVGEIEADFLTIAGHKIYAPKGVGALYVRRGAPFEPLLRGGGQERGRRAGTENVAFAAALAAAIEAATQNLADASARMAALRDRLVTLLSDSVPGLAQNGDPDNRLPNTANVSFPGVSGAEVLAAAPEVLASTGAACHAGASVSHVLVAMGLSRERALGAVRLSLGRATTRDEVEAAAAAMVRAFRMLAG